MGKVPEYERYSPSSEFSQEKTESQKSIPEVKVEEKTWEGKKYLVDPQTNIIWTDDGEKIGEWTPTGPKLEESLLTTITQKEEEEDPSSETKTIN